LACSAGGLAGSGAVHGRAWGAGATAGRGAGGIRLYSHHCLSSSNRSPGERFLLIGCFKPRDVRNEKKQNVFDSGDRPTRTPTARDISTFAVLP